MAFWNRATKAQTFSLDAVRTDGWFERIGEGIASFQALCEIVGERFVAFSLITGAKITALSVDRRMLDNSLVDFVVGGEGEGTTEEEVQRLTLGEFRRRLVAALLADEPHGPLPQRETDIEALQLHIGVRYLLLAPLYGYSLRTLKVEGGKSVVHLLHDGVELSLDLETLRLRLRAHIREELDRVSSGNRGVIDLSRVAEAEAATERKDYARVKQLLGAWPAPLAIFLRTPDGQMLALEARSSIARGLALLGSAYSQLGEVDMAEEVFRLAVQYAQDGGMAGEVFRRMGEALLNQGRPGESIAALRRAINLGASGGTTWPLLARAFLARRRYVAALICVREALNHGVTEASLQEEQRALEAALGPALEAFRARVGAKLAPLWGGFAALTRTEAETRGGRRKAQRASKIAAHTPWSSPTHPSYCCSSWPGLSRW
ncbi:MAG: hypothetical protein NZX77_05130 [Polyangiaceae bacterium]|nr:hypothetical protein [Polyangiaceae bacterium]